ncbi:MAG: Gfo/Idh/MocA family oxidoreductase [Fuerstiella sp.]|jgi:predicted dehydrogenase
MVRIGIVGVGFMGYTHFEGARDLAGAKVVAIATRNEQKLAGDWTSIQGNFGPPGGQVDVSDLKCYSDYKELLADPDIDLVDVCVPTDKHHGVVLESLAAGKPTLVEKPISVDLPEAQEMVAAAEKAGVPLLVAHVLPFFPEFQFVAAAIRSNKFGKLRAGHFKRVICPPDWSSDMSDFRKLGGWGIDLHIHDNHFIAHALGTPQSVFSTGLLQDGFVNHVHTSYVYGNDGPAITAVSGGIAANGLAFGHGFELYFDDATLLFDAGTYGGEWVVSRPLTVITNDGKAEVTDLSGSDKWCAAFTSELQVAVNHLTDQADTGPLSSSLALDALRICYAEAKSVAEGRLVDV